ncbi:hypothetical protein [Photorhabdus heterorhabditis]|uniref:hypothetical protein n=1 Tax=Photorhabdus heterorhabditis TaxID=880156 RepID=UPI001561BD33|nr:hypothetical protein [Photorhabdus heterorhabditis]NRN26951.1 hypothetical protein [Photorhabdus heterorhabditis subsp. aluminescens]
MMIKGSRYIFVILSAISFQVFALNFDYKSDIPADNKPSADYLKKRENLQSKHWNVNELIADNEAAEKLEQEKQEGYEKKYTANWQESRRFNDEVNKRINREIEREIKIKENGGMTRSNFFDRE